MNAGILHWLGCRLGEMGCWHDTGREHAAKDHGGFEPARLHPLPPPPAKPLRLDPIKVCCICGRER